MKQAAERLRVGPFREDAFESPLHSTRVASWLGLALGVSFTVCFLTGLLSHVIQRPPSWFLWPSRPAGLYRITQGVHVATGIAAIPLLLAKLWTVYPKLWRWPAVSSVAHAVERVSLVPLVGGSLFLLFTGVGSITRWFPWSFSFPRAHYAASWIAIGGLVAHVGAKWTTFRLGIARANPERTDPTWAREADGRLSRRGLLRTAFAGAGLLTLATVGQTLRPLERLALLAPRRPSAGPQGLPVNKTAGSANVIAAATSPDYRLRVTGTVTSPLDLTLEELRALPQREAVLPIACVDGWSASAAWRGVPVGDLLAMAGAPEDAECEVRSLQDQRRPYSSAELNRLHAADADTLLALEVNGEPLHLDHGFPVGLIGPNRPGVMQTKWVGEVVVR